MGSKRVVYFVEKLKLTGEIVLSTPVDGGYFTGQGDSLLRAFEMSCEFFSDDNDNQSLGPWHHLCPNPCKVTPAVAISLAPVGLLFGIQDW
jgi:hypothetical protein